MARTCTPVTLDQHKQRSDDLFLKTTGRAVRAGSDSDWTLALNLYAGGLDADTARKMSVVITRPAKAASMVPGVNAVDEQMSLYDIYLESLLIVEDPATAGRRTASEVADIRKNYLRTVSEAEVDALGIPRPAEMNKLLKANLLWMGAIREGVMTSPFRVLSAASLDGIGNSWFQIISGHVGSGFAALHPKNVLAFAKFSMRGDELRHPTAKLFAKLELDIPPDVVDIVSRDLYDVAEETNMAQIFSFGGRFKPGAALSRPFASKWGRALRHGVDGNARLFMLGDQFKRVYQDKRLALFESMRNDFGDDTAQHIIDDLAGDRYFTPEALRKTAIDHGIDDPDALARRWREDLADSVDAGVKEVNRVHFKMQATKADEALRHVMLFHFWQSRAAVFYPRTVIGNPYLLYNHLKFWEALDKEAERQGFKNPMNMYFKFMQSDTGWFFQADPLSYLIPYTMIRDWAVEYQGESAFDKWSRRFGAFVNPGISAALSVLGASDQFPTLLPNATRGAIIGTINYLRNHGLDLGQGPGITGDPITHWERKVLNGINNMLADAGLVKDVEPFDPTVQDRVIVNDIIIRMAEDQFGMTYEQMLSSEDPRYRDTVAQAQIAAMTGAPNELAERALAEWSTYDQGANVLVRAIIPGYLPARSGTTQERQAANKAKDPNAQAISDQVTAATPEGATLQQESAAYKRIGTDEQRALAAGWNKIVYDELDINSFMVIGGKIITGGQINQMDQDQRKNVADAWVLQQERNPQGTGALTDYREERKGYAAGSQELTGFLDYQKRARDYDGGEQHVNRRIVISPDGRHTIAYDVRGGIRSFRQYLEDVSPEFADEIGQQRDYWASQGLTGEELEQRLDTWANSTEGYNAARGMQQSIYDAPPKEAYDPTRALPPAGPGDAAPSTSSSGGSTAKKKPKETTKPKWQTDLMTEWDGYQQAIAAFEQQYGSIERYGNPDGQVMLRRFLPEISRDLQRYLNWANDEIAAGRDGSMDAYLAYRDAQYRGEQDTTEEETPVARP